MANEDRQLLDEYVASGSQAAFAALARRHVDMVYSAAQRGVADAHLAEDVTQAVFLLLAQKAKTIRGNVVIAGWLFNVARYAAANANRRRRREIRREKEAGVTQQLEKGDSPEPDWEKIAPLLNDAVARLGQKDRDAIVLRFFEGRSHADVGAAMGISQDAAKTRTLRALTKLREILRKRGVDSPLMGLEVVLTSKAILAAPTSLAPAIAHVVAGAVTGSVSTIVEGVLHTMKWLQIKLLALIAAGAVVVSFGVVVAVRGDKTFQMNDSMKAATMGSGVAKIISPTTASTPLAATSTSSSEPAAPAIPWPGVGSIVQPQQLAGKLVDIDGDNLLLEVQQDAEPRPQMFTVATNQDTTFFVDIDRAELKDLRAGMLISCSVRPPAQGGSVRLSISAQTPHINGTLLKIDGRNLTLNVPATSGADVRTTVYAVGGKYEVHNTPSTDASEQEMTVATDDSTRILFRSRLSRSSPQGFRAGRLAELTPGMQLSVSPQTGTAKTVFVGPTPVRPVAVVETPETWDTPALPARQFNSTLSMGVFLVDPDGMPLSVGQSLGHVPAQKGISIPAGVMWCVAADSTVDHKSLAEEINAQRIPGLALNDVQADTDLSFLKDVHQLQFLVISGGGVTDADLADIKALINLRALYLTSDTNVTDAGLENLRPLTNLRRLSLSNTRVADAGLINLEGMSQLEMLTLDSSPVTDSGLQHLENLTALRRLYVAGTKITDAGLENLQGLTDLREVDLGQTAIGNAGLQHLTPLTSMRNLALGNTKVTGDGLKYLAGMASLEKLDVADTAVADTGLENLAKLTNLKELNLIDTQVTDVSVNMLEKMTSLRALDLSNSKITRSGVRTLERALPDCSIGD